MNRRLGTSGGSFDIRIVAIVGILLVGIAIVAVVVLTGGSSCGQFCGERMADEGRGHVANGTPDIAYKSVPATSGSHWETPAEWGIYGPDEPGQYAAPLPEPQSVHNLEHGGTVIWYQPTQVDAEQLGELRRFVQDQLNGSRFKIILSPWTGDDFGHPLAVVAWNWRLFLDEPNTDAIEEFIRDHYQKSPEPNGGPAPPSVQFVV
jgi:hypothetical protein